MNCSKCSAPLKEGGKFCNKCGAPVMMGGAATVAPSFAEVQAVCPKCGKQINESNKFCMGCGFALGTVTASAASGTPRKKNRLLIPICGLVVAALGVGGFVFLRGESGNTPAAVSSAPPVTSSAAPSDAAPSAAASSVPDNVAPDTPADAVSMRMPAGAQVQIHPEYDALSGGFDKSGHAGVKIGDSWHLIDWNGEIVTRYNYDSINFFSHNLAVVSRGDRYGYIDESGNEVIAVQFDDAFNFSEDSGLARIKRGTKFGYIDSSGDIAITPSYSDGRGFYEGYAAVSADGDIYHYIDTDGNRVSPDFEDARDFYQGVAAVKSGDKWGYADRDFNIVIAPQFDAADEFINGHAIVERNGKKFFIDRNGDRFSPECDNIWKFSDGYATALLNDKYGFIDESTGEFAIYPKYDDVWGFGDGICPVSMKKGEWYYVNANDELQFGGKQWQEAHKFTGLVAKIRVGNKWGFINADGKEIVPAEWDDAHFYSEGRIGVCRDGKWGFVEIYW